MATKTFKIGLSTSDKSAMAQDVYERLIAMCFDEYDSTKTYNAGDFVVYESPTDTFKLYKCLEDNVTGTWNSAKWELATFQDLVDDVEGAVASVDGKANVDGNYPTLTAGLADNLTPYSEDSGDIQDNPFISQGTGTNNNNEIVTVGDYGLLKEKQGHTLVVNQLAKNGNFASTSEWDLADANTMSKSASNNKLTFSTTVINGYIEQRIPTVANHVYIAFITLKSSDVNWRIRFFYNGVANQADKTLSYSGETLFVIAQPTVSSNDSRFRIATTYNSGANTSVELTNANVIDLTQWFNGDIPQDLLDNPEHFSWYYNGDLSYNTGTLVNANSERLVSTGRNQFDKSTATTGKYIGSDGSVQTYATLSYSDYIKVVPNQIYHVKETGASSVSAVICAYDKDKNFVGTITSYNGNVNLRQIPANVEFIIVNTLLAKLDEQVVSLYYTPEQGGEGYSEYYPYETPSVYDTGTETLRSAGSVKDYKTPDGVVHRVVGTYTFTGSESWTETEQGRAYCTAIQATAKFPSASSVKANILMAGYVAVTQENAASGTTNDKVCALNVSGAFIVVDRSIASNGFASAMSGKTVYFELAEPTTEQGTTFSENLPINDYGMLYWQESNGVPQGAEIFYPVNYKGFLDDMYSRASGDSSDYALNSELNTKFETYLKSLTGYDATATQVLKNVEGTLTWVTEE